MNIVPISTYIPPIGVSEGQGGALPQKVGQPSFLDVFTRVFDEAVTTNQTKGEDMIRLMLGDADDLEQIQLNIQKAELAVELLTNVRNTVLD